MHQAFILSNGNSNDPANTSAPFSRSKQSFTGETGHFTNNGTVKMIYTERTRRESFC